MTSYKVGNQVSAFIPGTLPLPENPDDAQGTLARKPTDLTYAEATTVPTAEFEALHFLRKAKIQSGKSVLIIGTFAIQLARHFGAEVTGVDSTEKLELIRSLVAAHVIDYTKGDYTVGGEGYDLTVDAVGKSIVFRCLKPDGHYFLAYAGLSHIFLGMRMPMESRNKLRIESAIQNREDLIFLKDLLETGRLKPVINRSFSLKQTVEAHRYVESVRNWKTSILSVKCSEDKRHHHFTT